MLLSGWCGYWGTDRPGQGEKIEFTNLLGFFYVEMGWIVLRSLYKTFYEMKQYMICSHDVCEGAFFLSRIFHSWWTILRVWVSVSARACALIPLDAGQVIRLRAAGQFRHRSTSDNGRRQRWTLRSLPTQTLEQSAETLPLGASYRRETRWGTV